MGLHLTPVMRKRLLDNRGIK